MEGLRFNTQKKLTFNYLSEPESCETREDVNSKGNAASLHGPSSEVQEISHNYEYLSAVDFFSAITAKSNLSRGIEENDISLRYSMNFPRMV